MEILVFSGFEEGAMTVYEWGFMLALILAFDAFNG